MKPALPWRRNAAFRERGSRSASRGSEVEQHSFAFERFDAELFAVEVLGLELRQRIGIAHKANDRLLRARLQRQQRHRRAREHTHRQGYSYSFRHWSHAAHRFLAVWGRPSEAVRSPRSQRGTPFMSIP